MPVVQPKKAGPGGIIAGVVLMVLGVVIGLVLIFTSARTMFNSLGNLVTVGMGSATTHQADGTSFDQNLTSDQMITIWASDQNVADCVATGPNGDLTPLDVNVVMPVTFNGYQLIGAFSATESGSYSISCQSFGDPFSYKAFTLPSSVNLDNLRIDLTSANAGAALGIIGGIAVIFVLGLTGLIVLIVSLVKRSNRNKAAALQYPYPGQQYPPMQYPPVQYPPAQPPQSPPAQP